MAASKDPLFHSCQVDAEFKYLQNGSIISFLLLFLSYCYVFPWFFFFDATLTQKRILIFFYCKPSLCGC